MNDSQVPGAQPVQVVLQQGHVLRTAQKRERHHVHVLDDLLKAPHVLLRERRHGEGGVREIDALFLAQAPSGRAGAYDFNGYLFSVVVANHPGDLPVVEHHPFSRLHLLEGCFQGAVNPRRHQQGA